MFGRSCTLGRVVPLEYSFVTSLTMALTVSPVTISVIFSGTNGTLRVRLYVYVVDGLRTKTVTVSPLWLIYAEPPLSTFCVSERVDLMRVFPVAYLA